MNRQTSGRHSGGGRLRPGDLRWLGNPLDFISKDHLRKREINVMLERIAEEGSADPAELIHVRAFLREELPLHLADEEEDLFPLMRRRCPAEDEIGRAIARLTSDHIKVSACTATILASLERLGARDGQLPPSGQEALCEYAARARRHLILENAVILPLARRRLTLEDLDTLRLRMLQRRGLDRLMTA